MLFFRKTNSLKQIYRDGKGLKHCFGYDIFLHKCVFLVVSSYPRERPDKRVHHDRSDLRGSGASMCCQCTRW